METADNIVISVIIPVYNVEKYLDDCINSITGQTHTNLEIILVDDGSTDASGSLCDRWAAADKRVTVYHKANGGLSDARNYGIDRAHGTYLGFVDSDDRIDKTMYASLLEAALSFDAEVAVCRIKRCESTRDYATREFSYPASPVVFTGETATRELFQMKMDESSCNKLFKATLFDNVRYPKGKTNEDFAVLYKLLLQANRVVYRQEMLYHYIRREGSITTQGFSQKQFDKYFNCLEMVQFIEDTKKNLSADAKQYLWQQTFRLIKDLYLRGLQKQYSQPCRVMRKTLRAAGPEICGSKEIPLKEKIVFLAAGYMPGLYVWQYAKKHPL